MPDKIAFLLVSCRSFLCYMRALKLPYKNLPCQLFIIAALLCFVTLSNAQTEQRYNRFQYHKFHWRSFHAKAFHVYFPVGNDSLCVFISKEYAEASEWVKKNMGTSFQKEPSIIIYPSADQLYESNIGSFEPKEYTLPTFVSKGSRLLLYFNGSYADLIEQLKEAIARSIWEEQFKQSSMAGQAKSVSKDEPIPLWFREGAIRYFAHGWTIDAEDALHRSFRQNAFSSWQEVISYQPRLSGQAFCYFLSDRYYKEAVIGLFFQLKKKKQLQRAIRLVAKRPLDSLYIECLDYYRKRFELDMQNDRKDETASMVVPHKEGIVKAVHLSPDKKSIAYVLNTYNKRTVYCYNSLPATTSKISTYLLPPWIGDHSADVYPLINWDTKGTAIVVTQPVKGKIVIRNFSTGGTEIENVKLYGVDGLTTVIPQGNRQYLFAAYRKGQTDIVSYNDNKEKYIPLTNDIYDDANPFNGTKSGQVIFVSDRPIEETKNRDSIEPLQGVYAIEGSKMTPVVVDSIPFVKWDKPALLDDRIIATHTKYGNERFAIVDHNTITTLSEYHPYQYMPKTNEMSFYKNKKDSLAIQAIPLQKWIEAGKAKAGDTTSPWLKDYRRREAQQAKEDSILKRAKNNNPSFLEDVFTSKNTKKHAKQITDSMRRKAEYDPKKVKPYILQLHSAYFTAKVNNDYFINRYQPYLNYQGQFKFPEVGGMVQGGLTDLFENHHFKISYRLPAGTEGSDFFIHYQNTARKVDWGLTYFRKVESLKPDPNRNWVDEFGRQYPGVAKVKTYYYDVSLRYPLSYDCSLGLQEAVRNDRTIFIATNKYSLTFEDIKSVWSITTLSGELNKLRPTVPNLFKGFKANAAVDVFKGFSQQEALVLGSTVHLQYHQPIYKYITLVAQAQGGYSAGDQKVLYTLGGVDNNVTPKIDSTVTFSQTAPYAFQSLVTPFRGYLQNSIYGNQYLLFNADIYFPIFQTLIPIETPLSAINNLQLGIFADAGNAKESWRANVNNAKWLYSYGISARTTLAGYPLRFDIAWPGSFNKSPVWYLSLNLK